MMSQQKDQARGAIQILEPYVNSEIVNPADNKIYLVAKRLNERVAFLKVELFYLDPPNPEKSLGSITFEAIGDGQSQGLFLARVGLIVPNAKPAQHNYKAEITPLDNNKDPYEGPTIIYFTVWNSFRLLKLPTFEFHM